MKILCLLSSVLLFAFTISGCASYPRTIDGLMAKNIYDLEKARKNGIQKVYDVPMDEAINREAVFLEAQGLTVFEKNTNKGYLVVMGFKKQVDTTRVGVFFEPHGEGKTLVTISSLSDSALKKAEKIMFKRWD